VDKTAFIGRLLDKGKHYFLSCPRRFGKSLFLDTCKEPRHRGQRSDGVGALRAACGAREVLKRCIARNSLSNIKEGSTMLSYYY